MTRRAGTVTEETKSRLMQIAAYEFATKGFQGSSLRDICQKAGLSTGSVYFFFNGKDDLFRAIVEMVTTPLEKFLNRHFTTETTYVEKSLIDNEKDDVLEFQAFLGFYYEHKTNCDVLLFNRSHPFIAQFFKVIEELYENHYLTLINNIAKAKGRSTPIDEFAVRWFARTNMQMSLDIIAQGFSEDEAIEHAKNLVHVMENGFTGLL